MITYFSKFMFSARNVMIEVWIRSEWKVCLLFSCLCTVNRTFSHNQQPNPTFHKPHYFLVAALHFIRIKNSEWKLVSFGKIHCLRVPFMRFQKRYFAMLTTRTEMRFFFENGYRITKPRSLSIVQAH